MKIALDEYLLDHQYLIPEILADDSISDLQFIVKPTLFSLRAAAPLMLMADPKRLTISCTFETGPTLAFLVCVAAASVSGNCGVHGLYPHPAMVKNDQKTCEFSKLISSEGFINVLDCARLACYLS